MTRAFEVSFNALDCLGFLVVYNELAGIFQQETHIVIHRFINIH